MQEFTNTTLRTTKTFKNVKKKRKKREHQQLIKILKQFKSTYHKNAKNTFDYNHLHLYRDIHRFYQ